MWNCLQVVSARLRSSNLCTEFVRWSYRSDICWPCPFLLLLLPNNSYYKHRIERVVSFTCANQFWLHTWIGSVETFMLMTLYTTSKPAFRSGQTSKGFCGLWYKAFPKTQESIPPATRVSVWLSIAAHSLSGSASAKPTWTEYDFHLSFITRTKLDYWAKLLEVLDHDRPLSCIKYQYVSNMYHFIIILLYFWPDVAGMSFLPVASGPPHSTLSGLPGLETPCRNTLGPSRRSSTRRWNWRRGAFVGHPLFEGLLSTLLSFNVRRKPENA